MDYKVILFNSLDAAAIDQAGNFEFYTHDEAELCCQRWVSTHANYRAYLWNGDTWRYFS